MSVEADLFVKGKLTMKGKMIPEKMKLGSP